MKVLAAAHHVYTRARERGLGTWVEIGGRHVGTAVKAYSARED